MKNFSDFTNAKVSNKPYDGASAKIPIVIEDKHYLLKLPDKIRQSQKDTSYANSCISEYLACKIYKSLNIPVQEVYLGLYNDRIVVACEDFTDKNWKLGSFQAIQNRFASRDIPDRDNDLLLILKHIERQTILNVNETKQRLFDMIVIDTLTANYDRHKGNWGYLYNEDTEESKLAPVFDCGASFFPLMSIREREHVLVNRTSFDRLCIDKPNSVIELNLMRINLKDFLIDNRKNCFSYSDDVGNAIKRIVPKININTIQSIIREIPQQFMADIDKEFYCTVIERRYNQILKLALKNELRYERQKNRGLSR